MKIAGFSALHDRTIIEEEYCCTDGDTFVNTLTSEEILRIVNYLQSGTMVFSMTLALFDKENYIGPYCIYTDGEWLWPSHLAYYLGRGKLVNLSIDFRDHVLGRQALVAQVSTEARQQTSIFVEQHLLKLGEKTKRRFNITKFDN